MNTSSDSRARLWAPMDACHLAQELLHRTRRGDLRGAVALFDHEADVTPPGLVGRGRGTAAVDLCEWLAECFPEDAPVQSEVSGRDTYAIVVFRALDGPSGEASRRRLATVLIEVGDEGGSRITRARLLADHRRCAAIRQVASDAREDAARRRYLDR